MVTRNGAPGGELAPRRRRRFVSGESVSELFRAAPSIELARLRRDLDVAANQGIEPRA